MIDQVSMQRLPEEPLTGGPATLLDRFENGAFPHSITLHLAPEEFEKLGLDPEKLPAAGKEYHIECCGIITRASTEDPDADGDVDGFTLELQIRSMGIEHEDAGEERDYADDLYGDKD